MPRTLPWLTGDNKAGGTGGSKREIKPQPDFDSNLDRTPKATQKASKNEDIFRSCEYNIIAFRDNYLTDYTLQLVLPYHPPDNVHPKSESQRTT